MSSSKSTRLRGGFEDLEPPRVSTKPTDALPGTEEKIQVMMERTSRHLSCFNPEDARWEDANGQ